VWSTEAAMKPTEPTPLWGAGNPGSSHPAGIWRPGPKRPKTSQRVEAESVKMNDGDDRDRSVAASLSVLICRDCGAPTRERSADAEAMRVISAVLGAWHDATMTSRLVHLFCVLVMNASKMDCSVRITALACTTAVIHCTLCFLLAHVGHCCLVSCSEAI
jgi:hypothetical protein